MEEKVFVFDRKQLEQFIRLGLSHELCLECGCIEHARRTRWRLQRIRDKFKDLSCVKFSVENDKVFAFRPAGAVLSDEGDF